MESVRGEQAKQDVCVGPSDKPQGCAEQRRPERTLSCLIMFEH